MQFVKRIFLFMAVNILVMATLSITLNLLGVGPYLTAYGIDYRMLMEFCLVWGMGGAFISLGMSRMAAKWMLGVRVIDPDHAQGEAAELVQTVHHLAQGAGLPAMPEVGVYDSPEVNAFATGPTRSRALVAVSTGILAAMDRGQLDAVLGHEITHVANGDMVTMTLIQGVVNSFVLFFSRIIAFAVSQRVEEKNRYWTRYVITMLLDIVLTILGSLVVAWFSRWREYRADAGGARLAGRDKMIGALRELQRTMEAVDMSHSRAIASLKIAGPRGGLLRLFASHPPLEDRIAALQRMA